MTQTNPELLEEYRRRAKRSPWLAYPFTAVPAILPWHESSALYRVLSGPNGGGKTTAGAMELVSYATGYNPIRGETYDTPNVCWGVSVEHNSAGRVMFRKLSELLPRNENGTRNWKYYKQEHLIVLGKPYHSEIYIKSQKEGESSLLGERCTAIWVDEAMGGERGNENFGELQARGLPDQPLYMFFTLTPKMDIGLDWMRRKLWTEPGQSPHEDFIPGTFCHRFVLEDCLIEKGGFVSPQRFKEIQASTDPDEVEARLHGLWTPFMSRPAFSYKLLMRCMERAPKSQPVQFKRDGFYRSHPEEVLSGPVLMQRQRESAHNYIAAWDPASGLGKGHDASSLVVLDRGDLTVVLHARSTDLIPERFFHEIVLPACQYYNEAKLVIESNGEGGGAAIQAAKDSNYGNLYTQKRIDKQDGGYTDRLGWNTNEQSRGRMIDSLQRALREDKWTPCKDLLEEMSHMTVKRNETTGKIKVEHADGYHDDLPMACGMLLAVHYEEPVYDFPDFAKLRVRYGPTYTSQNLAFN